MLYSLFLTNDKDGEGDDIVMIAVGLIVIYFKVPGLGAVSNVNRTD